MEDFAAFEEFPEEPQNPPQPGAPKAQYYIDEEEVNYYGTIVHSKTSSLSSGQSHPIILMPPDSASCHGKHSAPLNPSAPYTCTLPGLRHGQAEVL